MWCECLFPRVQRAKLRPARRSGRVTAERAGGCQRSTGAEGHPLSRRDTYDSDHEREYRDREQREKGELRPNDGAHAIVEDAEPHRIAVRLGHARGLRVRAESIN